MTTAAASYEIAVREVTAGAFEARCDALGCDWMATAASKSAIGAKRNKHAAEHAAAIHGSPVEPTIYDAIEQVESEQAIPASEGTAIAVGEVIKDLILGTPGPVTEIINASGMESPTLPRDTIHLPEQKTPALLALEARAGAPDTDRPAWLAMRRNGVTATEIAKIAKSPTPAYAIAELVREKIEGSTFTGNAYTAWGKEREPYLEAAGLRGWGIQAESRVFAAEANPRHLASPDGICINEDGTIRLGEYKTSGKELTWDKMCDNGYYDQIQWQLYVMGAQDAILVWEWRRPDPEGIFYAEPGGYHHIVRDERRIAHLLTLAEQFLAELDEAEEHGLPTEDQWLDNLVARYVSAKDAAREAEEALRDYLGETGIDKARTSRGVVSYTLGGARKRFDSTAFREAHPDLYEQFMVEGEAPTQPTMRVTPRKPA